MAQKSLFLGQFDEVKNICLHIFICSQPFPSDIMVSNANLLWHSADAVSIHLESSWNLHPSEQTKDKGGWDGALVSGYF